MKCPLRASVESGEFFDLDCLMSSCAWWVKRTKPDRNENGDYIGEKDNSSCAIVAIADRLKQG